MTAALTDTEVARLRGLLDALDSALRLHDSTTDHHPDAVEILRAMNAAGRGEEVAERGEPDWDGPDDLAVAMSQKAPLVIDGTNWPARINGPTTFWLHFGDGLYSPGHGSPRLLEEFAEGYGPLTLPDGTPVVVPTWEQLMIRAREAEARLHSALIACDEIRGLQPLDVLLNVSSALRGHTPTPAPDVTVEPAVDWEARAKAAENRIRYAMDLRDDVLRHEIEGCSSLACRMARILRGKS